MKYTIVPILYAVAFRNINNELVCVMETMDRDVAIREMNRLNGEHETAQNLAASQPRKQEAMRRLVRDLPDPIEDRREAQYEV